MAKQYDVVVRHCPDDESLGCPRFRPGSRFTGVDFMESLYGAVFPKYMLVEFSGAPHHAPDADGALWTVGPHPLREDRQALYEYEGVRVLASKPKKPSTLIDITREVALETKYYTWLVEIVIEAKDEESATFALHSILSPYEGGDGVLIDWDFIEEEYNGN